MELLSTLVKKHTLFSKTKVGRAKANEESAFNAGVPGDMGSIPGSGRSPGGRHSNPLQYSCLESPMDRGA